LAQSIPHLAGVSAALRRRAALKIVHFRWRNKHQNLSGLKIAHYNATNSEIFD
jgi:hypothetical protein